MPSSLREGDLVDSSEFTRKIAAARIPLVRVVVAIALLMVALARTIDFSRLGQRMDETFLILLGGPPYPS